MQYSGVDDQFKEVSLGNKKFYSMNATISTSGIALTQTYYSTVVQGFALSIIISYMDEEQHQELLKALSTLSFNSVD